jgi:hypothetical protein
MTVRAARVSNARAGATAVACRAAAVPRPAAPVNGRGAEPPADSPVEPTAYSFIALTNVRVQVGGPRPRRRPSPNGASGVPARA